MTMIEFKRDPFSVFCRSFIINGVSFLWMLGGAQAAPQNIPSALAPASPVLKTYSVEVERDVPLTKQVPITLIHHMGELSVQGWVQDRIRVKMKKHVIAESQEKANQLFKQIDLLTLETSSSFEMRMGMARGADLVTKLKVQRENQVEVDLEVKAPYQLDLSLILGKKHDFSVQSWKGPLNIESMESTGQLSKLNLKGPLKLNCLDCELDISDSTLNGHVLTSTRPVVLRSVVGESLMISTSTGDVNFEDVSGKFMVHTESGKFTSHKSKGDFSYQSNTGGMFLTELTGNVEAHTYSGQMVIDVEELDKLINLDSQKGDIHISLKSSFEGKLDLSSLKGDVVVQFPISPIKNRAETNYGPVLPGKINALVGSRSSAVIHAETKQGGIRILRRDPQAKSK